MRPWRLSDVGASIGKIFSGLGAPSPLNILFFLFLKRKNIVLLFGNNPLLVSGRSSQ
jgi:hypothetical protein